MSQRLASPFLARLYDPVMAVADRLFLARYRAGLAEGIGGRVLDLGAGTGAMFPYYERQEAVESVLAIEPDPEMRRRGRNRAAALDLPVQWLEGIGETLPVRDRSIDTVVCAIVLCTVDDLERVIEESARVLAPNGELRVLEHVAAQGIQQRLQRAIRPAWSRFAGGCRPDRATDRLLEHSAHVEPMASRRLSVGIPPIRPFHLGRYRLPTADAGDVSPKRSD